MRRLWLILPLLPHFSYLYSTIVYLANQGKFFIIFFSSAAAALEVFLPSLYLSDQCQKTHEIEAKNATAAAMSSSYLPSKASETKMGNSKWMKGKLWLFDSFWSRFYRFRACFLRGSHLTAKVKNSHWKNRYEIIHIQYRSPHCSKTSNFVQKNSSENETFFGTFISQRLDFWLENPPKNHLLPTTD